MKAFIIRVGLGMLALIAISISAQLSGVALILGGVLAGFLIVASASWV